MSEKYSVKPYQGRIKAELSLPGSKSITNRALLLSALADGKTKLFNFLFSDDTDFMFKALRQTGMSITADDINKTCEIEGGKLPEGSFSLFVGNAGTAMRFLSSYYTLGKGEFLLDGDERMRQRPIQDLLNALSQLGCNIQSVKDSGCPPVRIISDGMPGGECMVVGKNSSQYISSILMSAPYSRNGVRIKPSGEVASRPYLDMTIKMMEQFGLKISRNSYKEFSVPAGAYKSPGEYYIEPDASSASYFLAAAAILGGEITIKGLGRNSLQGDALFVKYLEQMGCSVELNDDLIKLISDGKLKGIDADMNSLPDMAPTLAVTALFAEGPTRIRNVANLRIKESDRISALAAELKKLGAEVKESAAGLDIFPKNNYNHALIETYNDHRIAMAFSIAGLKIEGVEISNPSCVSKTFPDFYEYFGSVFNNQHNF